jgi:predicted dehydrogenase
MSSAAEKIPSCVIGLGRIASLLEDDPCREKPCTHAGAIAASRDCFLAGGMDIDAERRAQFARKWGCPVYDSAESMLRELKPAAVHVATHPESHLEYCLLAERFGARVVVCEKPLAHTLRAARKIAAIAERGAVKIIVNHERRYSRDYQNARRLIESGALGRLVSVSAKLYMGKDRRILDILWHDGTHIADIAAYLAGGVLRHKKTCGSPLSAKTGSAFLAGELRVPLTGAAEESVPFCLETGAGRDHLVFELDLSLERGRIRIGNNVYEVWKSAESPYAAGFRSLAPEASGFSGPTGYFARMVEDAARLARLGADADADAEPLSGAKDGLRVIEYLTSVSRWK